MFFQAYKYPYRRKGTPPWKDTQQEPGDDKKTPKTAIFPGGWGTITQEGMFS